MSLKEDGFRWIYRKGLYRWVHPAELLPGDVDCTDMGDEEYTHFVETHE